MYLDSKILSECSGCSACVNACPTSAIRMKEDCEGFFYPSIDESKCVNCNLCRKVCSWENPQYENAINPLVMAAISNSRTERQKSTSGGVFFVIAKWIINHGGIVYGAAFDEKLRLHHDGVESMGDLYKLRGSKYLQSNIGGIFKDIKKHLIKGRWCYFTGTGCQVAGLKAYLGKDYPTLITSDLVCHGVPSQKMFNEHIAYVEKKYDSKVVNYQFRDYETGNGCETIYFANRSPVKNRTYEISPYLYSFMYGLTCRYSCYKCKFARLPRQGDITLADFWGVQNYFPHLDWSNGCSLLLLNSEKGYEIWDKIKSECVYHISNIEDASKNNGNLLHPTSMPPIRATIYKQVQDVGYGKVVKDYFRSPNYMHLYIRNYILNMKVLIPFLALYRRMKRILKM